MFGKGMVVQFTEKHKWAGCLGIITEVKESGADVRYMIAVPIPEQGTAYIFSMESEFELITGFAKLVPRGGKDE